MTEEAKRIGVLFVCMGNLCRSPVAEGVFRAKAVRRGVEGLFDIDSAGTGDWHVGEAPDERMRITAAANGVILDSRARQVNRRDFKRFEHIICMDEENREDLLAVGAPMSKVKLLLEFDPQAPMAEVPDPYYGEQDGFDLVYRLVDGACEALLDELLSRRSEGEHGVSGDERE